MSNASTQLMTRSVEEIFGHATESLPNYYPRNNPDSVLASSIQRKRTIVVHGDPHCGKTTLIIKALKGSNDIVPSQSPYIQIHCTDAMTKEELYKAILKEAGYLTPLETTTTGSTTSITPHVETGIPDIVGLGMEGKLERESTNEFKQAPLPLNPSDPNDIIRELKSLEIDKYIVLEDAQLLCSQVLEAFALDLKALIESGFLFIIVGTNNIPELLRRKILSFSELMDCISVPPWDNNSLKKYITLSEQWLNIKFSERFIQSLLILCCGNISIVKRVCKEACLCVGIKEAQPSLKMVADNLDVAAIVSKMVADYMSSDAPELPENIRAIMRELTSPKNENFEKYLKAFSEGLKPNLLNQYFYYKWILYRVITATPKELKDGITLDSIKETIKVEHPKNPKRPDRVRFALEKIEALQETKCGALHYLKYDATEKKLTISDNDFRLWVAGNDKNRLYKLIDISF